MRNKRLFSTVVASTLVATTIAMPVMAADQNTVNVEFTTKTPVIRVVAPTSILAAVDPLEMNTSGTQIHSTDFTLANKSEVAVGIDVKSVVTLGTGVTLVDTKQAAVDSTDSSKSEAWLAVAAETSDGKYIETSGKTAGDLTDADVNVATFKTESSESSASQTFYLDKAASGSATYKLIAPVATGGKTAAEYKAELTYAQVYELTAATYADADALLAAVATADIYFGSADADGTALTLIPAGTKELDTTNAFSASNKYFTASAENALTTSTAANQITDGKKYVYGEGGAGDDTAFRYIGKLGSGKTSWTDTDIDEMAITYSIYGLTDDKYAAAADQMTDQLYTPVTTPAGPSITSGATAIETPGSDGATYAASLTNGTATEIAFNLPDGMSIQKVYANGNPANLTTENTSIATSSGNKVTLLGNSSWATSASGTVKYIKVVVDKGNTTTQDFIIKITCN